MENNKHKIQVKNKQPCYNFANGSLFTTTSKKLAETQTNKHKHKRKHKLTNTNKKPTTNVTILQAVVCSPPQAKNYHKRKHKPTNKNPN